MLHIPIPGRDLLALEHLVCDLNGTLAEDGLLFEGVSGRLVELSASLTVHILTADTHGTGNEVAEQLRQACIAAGQEQTPHWQRVQTGLEKERYVRELGAHSVVAIGNGANDEAMFRIAGLSIAVLGSEGSSPSTLLAAHIVAPSSLAALDLLLYPDRLAATLRL
jgi:soluble P-type ATPase